MLVQHQSPYTYDAPYGPYPSVWMPTAIGMFFLVGFISCDMASKLWLTVEIVGFLWMMWAIADYKMPSRRAFFTCLLVFFLFPPLWTHAVLGQFSMMFAISMVIIVYVPQARRFTPFLLILGLAKPQLVILVYPGLMLSIWRREGFCQVLRLLALAAATVLLSLIPLTLSYPNWVENFVLISIKNLAGGWNLPSLFVQLPAHLGKIGYVIWAIVLILAMAVSTWLWIKKDPKIALIISLALTPMVTLYSWSWDLTLLLPAFFWLTIKLKSALARGTLFLGMASVIAIQIAARWGRDIDDSMQWWISPALIFVYLLSLAVEFFGVSGKLPFHRGVDRKKPGLFAENRPD